MKITNDGMEAKRGFKERAANVLCRYLIGSAERSTKASPIPTVYEPHLPLEILQELQNKKRL